MTEKAHEALVTGGTGLIGGELILRLAAQGTPVCAVVRATSDAHARRRLYERLEKSARFDPALMQRVRAVAGDTTAALFGLRLEQLAGVTRVIHCAADTKFSESHSVWNTNVDSASNLVGLVANFAPRARVVFVSTASVVTGPNGACVDEYASPQGHANTYTRSKRRAEEIVEASGLDAVIVRPSIVLSRGVRDRGMARSILWAVPIMAEIGEVPVDPGARIDLVPVDFVADAVSRLAAKPALKHRRYHISAGDAAFSFAQMLENLGAQHPAIRRIRPLGHNARACDRTRQRLLRPLGLYLPFINSDVRYANGRLRDEIGNAADPVPPSDYLSDLIAKINLREAYEEMARP